MSRRGPCADCDPSTASTASVSSDLHKYHVACTCGGAAQYAECASAGPAEPPGPGTGAPVKEPRPPALPPRPPPRPRARNTLGGTGRSEISPSRDGTTARATSSSNNASGGGANSPAGIGAGAGPRKYVWWCLGMGATACLLGGMLLAAAMLLRAHTDSLHHLETIPTPVPAAMLVATGLCIMSLARRRNRYSYLIKVVGACCLVCALTCVLVTITTTVIHMNRLQTLRKCVYTEKTRTCTCYSVLVDGQNAPDDEEGVKCVFESVVDCGTVHNALYKCLGAVFGLSVAGVLVCICSAMLAYQLLSHERKKMYWEQLELRCRSLYRPAGTTNATGQGGATHSQQPQVCDECCAECRAAAAVSWDLQHRFWAPGRVGNLYSPNPGTGRRVSPWSWFPWPRNSNQRVGGSSSGDSAYGFGNSPGGYWQLGPPPPYTPHHRYLHQQIQAAHQLASHHHHQQAAAGALLGRPRGQQTHGQRRTCESHQHTVSEDFSEELEEIHQHTCQKYQHPVAESVEEAVVMQGEENLAFQCEKQSPQRQARSGESELYFADVSSCCNVSLKAIEYCGGGLIGTMDSQGDTSSGESDGQGGHGHHRKQHRHHAEHHAQGMAACSQSPNRTRPRNSNLPLPAPRDGQNRANRACEIGCRPSHMRGAPNRNDGTYLENDEEICQSNSGTFHCMNPECSRLQRCEDDSMMRSNEMLRRISENNEERDSPNMQCPMSGTVCQNSGNFNCHNAIDRSSIRVRQSPNRSSFICRQQSPIRANCVGLPTSSPNSFNGNESDFVNSQMRRRSSREENILNYGGATSSLAQIRRRNEDDSEQFNDVRRQTIEEELFKLDNTCVSYKRKAIDENLLNESAIDVHLSLRRQAIEEAILNNSMEMMDEATLASMRRNTLEDSILNCSVNQTIASLQQNKSSHDDQNDSQIMKRKAIDGSMLCNEDISFSPIRNKALNDSINKEQNISMSPLRRRVLEESLNNEMNNSLASIRRKGVDDSMGNEMNSSISPLRRKALDESAEQNISLSQIRKNRREDSTSSDELNISMNRRKVNNEDAANNDQNVSISPLRRKILEDKLNNDCVGSIALSKKAIEEMSNDNMRTKVLEELLNNDQSIVSRRKGIEDILNNQLEGGMQNLKSNLVQMVQNGNFTINYNNGVRDALEESLASEMGGSRRGIIEGACLGPDLRYEPVQGFGNDLQTCEVNDDGGTQNPVHLRCCSDSNTMDSGWQSGSEKHITD